MKRRSFLILGGLSTTGLLVGSTAYRVGAVWWDQEAASDYRVLSEGEAVIAASIADALFPGDHLGMPRGSQVGVVSTLDGYLAAIDEKKTNLLRLLLHAIDDMAVIKGFGMTRFHRRPLEERIEILNAWDGSRLNARREAFQGLKIIMTMGYCESPQVIRAAGIDYECGVWQ